MIFAFSWRSALAALLFSTALTASAQSPTPAAYIGPRFAAGPDSLRALLYRSVKQAGKAPAGRVALKVELTADGKPQSFTPIPPPESVKKGLVNAASRATEYLSTHAKEAWLLGPANPDSQPSDKTPRVLMALDFNATALATRPYQYADQNPVFAGFADQLRARPNTYTDRILASPAKLAELATTSKGLMSFVQMQVRYPVEALRNQTQGQVYAYFEVAESGAIEQAEILGTAGRALDAEVLRVIKELPAATTPAMLQGRPVRVSYVVPITFKIR
jgi:TonB family protein